MSLKPLTYIVFLIALLVLMLMAAVWLHLSTWFLWSLLPDGNLKIALNHTQPGSPTISGLLALSPLPEEIQPALHQVRRFAYVQSNDSAVIALIPSNPLLFRERHQLEQQLLSRNWQLTNYGLIIIGTKGNTSLNPLSETLSRAYHKLFSRQYPYRPVVIIVSATNTIPSLSSGTALLGVATNHGQELKIVTADSLSSLPDFSISSPALPATDDYLSLNLPGSTIQSIVNQFGTQWDELLRSKMGLTVTQPSIINLLAAQQTASLTITGQDASIAMIGHPATLNQTINRWLSDEEAYSRPQKSAFKLPDGTLGYELVKGDPQPVLAPADQSGCQAPLGPMIKVWLCQNEQGISIGTSRDLASLALTNIASDQQTISIGQQYLDQINLPAFRGIKSLVLSHSDPYTVLTVRLK